MTEQIRPADQPSLSSNVYASAVAEASANPKPNGNAVIGGVLYGLDAYNGNAAARWIQVFDSAALPADTAVPMLTIPVAIGASVSRDFGSFGMSFLKGLWVCNSSTGPTKTIGAADSLFNVRFK